LVCYRVLDPTTLAQPDGPTCLHLANSFGAVDHTTQRSGFPGSTWPAHALALYSGMTDQEAHASRSLRARRPSERSRNADEQRREQLASQNDAALCEADVLIASASGSTKARGVPLSHHSPPARHTQGFPRRPRVPTCTRAAPAPRVAGAMEAYVRRPRPAAGRCAKGRPHRSSGATQDRRPPSRAPSFPSACSSSTARTSIRARPTHSRPQSVSSVRRARCASRTSMATQANVCCTLATSTNHDDRRVFSKCTYGSR